MLTAGLLFLDLAACAPDASTPPPNYAEGVELEAHTLAWAYAALLVLAQEALDGDVGVVGASCTLNGSTGLTSANLIGCVGDFGTDSDYASCGYDGCYVYTDVNYQLAYIEEWTVDSPEAVASLTFTEDYVGAGVRPDRDGICGDDPGRAVLSFYPGDGTWFEVDGVTGELCASDA